MLRYYLDMANNAYQTILNTMPPKERAALAVKLDRSISTINKWRNGVNAPSALEQAYIVKNHGKAKA